MVFNSNVQPRVKKSMALTEWYCYRCDAEVKPYHKKCPHCKTPRND